MRKLLAVPGALILALGITGAASAVAPNNQSTISYTSSTTVGKKTLKSLTITATNTYGPAGSNQVPDIAFHTVFGLPVTVNSKGYESCTKDELSEYLSAKAQGQKPKKDCGKKALIGNGSATAYGVPCGKHPPSNFAGVRQITLDIQIYSAPNGLLGFLQVTQPSDLTAIKGIFEVNIAKTATGSLFTYNLPQSLLSAVKGLCSPITNFSFTINKAPAKTKKGKKNKKLKKFTVTAPCKQSPWTTTFHEDKTDGSTNPDGTLTDVKIDTSDASAATPCTSK